MQHSFIFQLIGISNLLEEQPDLENGLREVASLTAQTLKTGRCSIMLLSEAEKTRSEKPYLRVFTHYGELPESAYREMTPWNEGIAGYVVATGKPLLIEDISQSSFAFAARYLEDSKKSLISVPIILGKQVIGVLNVSNPLQREYFKEEDLELLELFALFVGKSINIAQLQTILRSKFVEIAVARELEEGNANPSFATHSHPPKLAKIVAKSFFRELTQAGFGVNQIIEIANEVLNLLQTSLKKHKKRLKLDDSDTTDN